MALSQNGWVAKNYGLMERLTVKDTDITVTVRRGDVAVVLGWLLDQYNKRVEPLRQSDTGGYNPRSIIGNHTLSNHASGTAVDVRWRDHPLGRRGTFSADQVREIESMLKYLEGIVRWGGHYKTRADEMHFEIVADPADVKRVANKIRRNPDATGKASKPSKDNDGVLEIGDAGDVVKKLQTGLNKVFPSYSKLRVDGAFGPATRNVVQEFQRRTNLKADGIVGPRTKAELKKHGINL